MSHPYAPAIHTHDPSRAPPRQASAAPAPRRRTRRRTPAARVACDPDVPTASPAPPARDRAPRAHFVVACTLSLRKVSPALGTRPPCVGPAAAPSRPIPPGPRGLRSVSPAPVAPRPCPPSRRVASTARSGRPTLTARPFGSGPCTRRGSGDPKKVLRSFSTPLEPFKHSLKTLLTRRRKRGPPDLSSRSKPKGTTCQVPAQIQQKDPNKRGSPPPSARQGLAVRHPEDRYDFTNF